MSSQGRHGQEMKMTNPYKCPLGACVLGHSFNIHPNSFSLSPHLPCELDTSDSYSCFREELKFFIFIWSLLKRRKI